MLGCIAYSLTTQHHIYPHSMFKLFTKNKSGTLIPKTGILVQQLDAHDQGCSNWGKGVAKVSLNFGNNYD